MCLANLCLKMNATWDRKGKASWEENSEHIRILLVLVALNALKLRTNFNQNYMCHHSKCTHPCSTHKAE